MYMAINYEFYKTIFTYEILGIINCLFNKLLVIYKKKSYECEYLDNTEDCLNHLQNKAADFIHL